MLDVVSRAMLYTPAALSFYTVFRTTRTIDFSIVAAATAALYLAVIVTASIVSPLQAIVSISVAAIAGPAVYIFLWRPVLQSTIGGGSTFLGSLALVIAVQAAVPLVLTASPVPFFDMTQYATEWLGISPFYKDFATRLAFGGAVTVVAICIMDGSLVGAQMAAIGDNPTLASVHINRVDWIVCFSYSLACVIATSCLLLEVGPSDLTPFGPMQVLLFGVVGFLLGGQRSAKHAAAGGAIWALCEVTAEYSFSLSAARALALVGCAVLIVWKGEDAGIFETRKWERPE